jgi:hypothetical protein
MAITATHAITRNGVLADIIHERCLRADMWFFSSVVKLCLTTRRFRETQWLIQGRIDTRRQFVPKRGHPYHHVAWSKISCDVQKFAEARQIFANWESCNREDPFGGVAVAASYLFEELYLQGVLTSDFFLNEKKYLHGIDGRPNPERMSHFGEALTRARELAKVRQKTNPNDGEALFALTLAAGMESDAESILQKKHMNGLKRMKEANKYAECLLANYPDATDAYIALGIANCIIGSESAGSRFALWFDGIHGDKKLGMEQVAGLRKTVAICAPSPKSSLPLPRAVKIRLFSHESCCGN